MTYRLLRQLDDIIYDETTERPFLGYDDTETPAYFEAEKEVAKLRQRITKEFTIDERRRTMELLLAKLDAEIALYKDDESDDSNRIWARDWLKEQYELDRQEVIKSHKPEM